MSRIKQAREYKRFIDSGYLLQSNIGEPVMDRYIKLYNAYKDGISTFGSYDELLKLVKGRLLTVIKVHLSQKMAPENRVKYNELLQSLPIIKTPKDVCDICKRGNRISKY